MAGLPDHPLRSKFKSLKFLEDGPVMKTIRIATDAPGCNSMITDIRIIDDLNLVEIINMIDKKKIISPEAVHIAFPFNIPGGIMRYDLAYGYCRPELDQLPGSNKNFMAMEHWLDISDEKPVSQSSVLMPRFLKPVKLPWMKKFTDGSIQFRQHKPSFLT